MALYVNAPYYLAGAYDRLGRMGLQYGRMLTDGYMNSRKANDLRRQLIKSTKMFRLMMYYTRYDSSGNFVGVNRITDDVYNKLLRTLIRTADVNSLPNSPKILYNGTPYFVFFGQSSSTPAPQPGTGMVSVTVNVSTNPVICDFAGNSNVEFVSNANVTGPKSWSFNNSGNGIQFVLIFTINGGLYDQSFPSNFEMSDPRWGISGPQIWSPLDQGKYIATAFFDKTNGKWIMRIDGPNV